jgi:hypothetical protein
MSWSELDRRLAGRIECRVPVRLSAGNRVLRTETTNLSRVGMLLRVPVSELGLEPHAPLGSVAEELNRVLGEVATAEFRYDVLGALVSRTMRLVRIGRTDPEGRWVEIGCALRRPISNDEAAVLGLDLPPLQFHPAVSARRELEAAAASLGDEGTDLRLVLCPEPGRHARPLTARAVEISSAGVNAVCEDLESLPARVADRRVGAVLSAITEAYGAAPTVVLMRDGRPVWSGGARIEMVEMSAADGHVHLQVKFAQDLGVPELVGLGVR